MKSISVALIFRDKRWNGVLHGSFPFTAPFQKRCQRSTYVWIWKYQASGEWNFVAHKEKSIPQRVIIQKKSMSRTSSTLSNQFPCQFFMLSMTLFSVFCFVFFIFLFAAPRYLNSFAPGYFAKETFFETGRAVFCSVSCQKEAKLPNYRKIVIYASISLKN